MIWLYVEPELKGELITSPFKHSSHLHSVDNNLHFTSFFGRIKLH